ncbi:DinB family protein [Flavobacterium sp. LaA7.5]|nr:DinB family protein [Flavobacterium salilacus subsp. altitudinum]
MEYTFSITRRSREILLGYLENYTLEQLNIIPEGFNNNMYWNIAHVVVSQQRLVYALSGVPEEMTVSDEMVKSYMRGTRPERDVTAEEVAELKKLLFTTIDKTEADYKNGLFKGYKEYTTEFGYTLHTVEEGMEFNNFHEGTHLGCILSLRKFL